jgi:predicted secreted protein with PEFG-CTERM motif
MMNFRIWYVFLVIFVVAGTSITSAFAAPISIETDSDVYDHSSKITVTGQIANVDPNYLAVALKVLSPNGNIAGVAQPEVNSDGSFVGTFNTSGYAWTNNGTYQITATYLGIDTTISIEIKDTVGTGVTAETATTTAATIAETETTSAYEFPEGQIAYDITCSTTSPSFIGNGDDSTLEIYIDATGDGELTIALDEEIIKPFDDGSFFVLVNNEEIQDFVQEGNKLTIPCKVGDEKISIVGSWAIPEFGTIAVMILVVAIVSIIIVSAKTKLSLVPRY